MRVHCELEMLTKILADVPVVFIAPVKYELSVRYMFMSETPSSSMSPSMFCFAA